MDTRCLAEYLVNKSIRANTISEFASMEVFGVSNKLGITVTDHKKSEILEKYLLIEEGDFAYNPYRINVGSIGLVPKGKRGLVSPAYVVFTTTNQLIPELLLDFLKSQEGLRQIGAHARGTVRKTLSFKDLIKIEIPIPAISKQKKILEKKKNIEDEVYLLRIELTYQQTLLKKLRQQILQEAIEGKLTADWRQKQKLSPCQGGVPQSGEGVRGEVVERIQKEVKKLNNLPYLKTFRKTLRKNLTPAEAKFWTLLKNKQLDGRRFRRQYSVANYILDFFCPAEKLAIELDGEVHSSTKAVKYDRERDIFLAHTGIKVLRFENQFVFHDPDGLLARIKQEFNPSASARHLPLAGEEFESASELLKRIQTEKEQLIKDKKIRKQKPLPPISEEEKPFELPDGWVWCRLGNIGMINPRNYIADNLIVGFSPMPFLSNRFGINPKYNERKWISVKKNFTHLKENDVVIAKITPCFENSKAGIIKDFPNGYGAGTTELHVFRNLKSFLETKFIYLQCKTASFLEGGRRIMTGAVGQKRVPKEYIENLLVALPPLAEQKAIVAKVEKLLALCDQLEAQVTQNQAHAEQLMQAVLKEAFTYMEPRKTLI